ncbi:unnamed protein product [Brassicogethes aeneus]|uniref:Phospholipase A2 n=1 Tax=Brassicogethes aeneus TaxID=1431903 RepID=A0A9P0FPM3_BRAAE|nr:unnamed protein product [Brassicogethes aeneus]
MSRWRKRWFCRLLVTYVATIFAVGSQEITNFVATNFLQDGELETRIYFDGVTAKETVSKGSGLKFRQLSDGKHLIQSIYKEENYLEDCEYGLKRDQVNEFLNTFKSDLKVLLTTSNVTVQSLDGLPLPDEFNWLNYTYLRKKCQKKHREIKELADNSRHKRDFSDLLRVPGTKWCGKGYSADKYTRLGGFSRTDKCCRKHDLNCPFWIGAFDTKYGLFNWRMNTLMHCDCDARFRSCLKRVRSSDANLVGKLFFNVVQTQCFRLKPKKTCVRSSWWGKCKKFKYFKQAILVENPSY